MADPEGNGRYYLGILDLVLSEAPTYTINDVVLLVAPTKETARLALQAHCDSLAASSQGLLPAKSKVQRIAHSVYMQLAPHLMTVSLFTNAAGKTWRRELRVPAEGDSGLFARTTWSAREIERVSTLLLVGENEQLSQVRQRMRVDWVDAQGRVSDSVQCNHQAEVVLRPYDQTVSFTCCATKEGDGHDGLCSQWIPFRYLSRLLAEGEGPVLIEQPARGEAPPLR